LLPTVYNSSTPSALPITVYLFEYKKVLLAHSYC